MQEFFTALILSLIQGLIEFVPISSSSHFKIISQLLPQINIEEAKFFAELATFLVILNYFKSIIIGHLMSLFGKNKRESVLFFTNIIAATLPICIIFLFFKNIFNIENIILFSIIGSLVMLISEGIFLKRKSINLTQTIEDVTTKQALIIGIFQILAGFGGVSRSGCTISGGLCAGLSRRVSVLFSFLIAIPVTFLSLVYSAAKVSPSFNLLNIFIFIATFAIAHFAIKFCFKILINYSLLWFVIYRLIFVTFLFIF